MGIKFQLYSLWPIILLIDLSWFFRVSMSIYIYCKHQGQKHQMVYTYSATILHVCTYCTCMLKVINLEFILCRIKQTHLQDVTMCITGSLFVHTLNVKLLSTLIFGHKNLNSYISTSHHSWELVAVLAYNV